MVTKLAQYKDQTVLILDHELLDQLKIDLDTPLNVETEGEMLIIAPVRDVERRKQFQEALAQTNQKYGKMLQRLAD
jgi:antitoxin component of MazEF toxin-antitoxin module